MDVFSLQWVTSPEISTAGDTIVYVRRAMDVMRDQRTSRLWRIDRDGSNHQALTSADANQFGPVWSPDGKRLAFVQTTEYGTEVFMYWRESGVVSRISQLPARPGALSWSPDVVSLAFSMLVARPEISLVSPPAAPKGADWPAAPRVTMRLYHEADGRGRLQPGLSQYFVLPASGGNAEQVTDLDCPLQRRPQWRADGKGLIFSANCVSDRE